MIPSDVLEAVASEVTKEMKLWVVTNWICWILDSRHKVGQTDGWNIDLNILGCFDFLSRLYNWYFDLETKTIPLIVKISLIHYGFVIICLDIFTLISLRKCSPYIWSILTKFHAKKDSKLRAQAREKICGNVYLRVLRNV